MEARFFKDALTVQDASNLSGVVFSFAEAMKAICQEAQQNNLGTDWKNNHPVARLFAEQIYFLTRGKDYFDATRECQEKVGQQKSAGDE